MRKSWLAVSGLGSLLLCSFWLQLAACSSSTGSRSNGAARADAGTEDAGFNPGITRAGSGGFEVQDAGRADASTKPDADTTGCGDGRLQPGEACDDGNDESGDGCSADCTQRERDFVCPAPGKACVSTVVCGDGRIAGREACDDGNLRNGDGCSDACKLEEGYACPAANTLCVAAKCGDRIVAGDELCDDNDETPTDGDGCSATCRLEAGWVCPKPGEECRKTVCNDGKREGDEACDDGNSRVGDGCTPFCEVEPDCSAGACKSRCGDGLVFASSDEACDDGNLVDRDGCSAQCKPESGFSCQLTQTELPNELTVNVTYRDFIASRAGNLNQHTDFELFKGSDVTPGLVLDMLGPEQTPVYAGICDAEGYPYPQTPPLTGPCPYNQQLTNRASFGQWYRDVSGVNVTKVERMTLARDANGTIYRVANAAFFPWDNDARSWVGQGLEAIVSDHNFGFTSEIHAYFEYKPNTTSPPTLVFTGDDDVWVFINRRLAVDIGGLHPEVERSVSLNTETAQRLGLEANKIYEIALFHAERHSPDSHFNLSLEGFTSARSRCETRCGDGVVAGRETCDDGKNDGSYGSCTADCKRASYCGDGKLDAPNEACDDGVNITVYSADGKPGCAPGCVASAYCGDGEVDSTAGEACDDGKNAGTYGGCGTSCQFAARCGDGKVQKEKGEACDDGNQVGGDGCSNTCQYESPD